MKLKSIAKASEARAVICAALGGDVEVVSSDDNVTSLRIGGLHITASPYGNNLKVSRVIEHEEVDRYRVRVDHPNFASLNRYFEDAGEAREFALPYETMADTTVARDSVTVHIDETGKVIAEVDGSTVRPLAPQDNGGDDLPF